VFEQQVDVAWALRLRQHERREVIQRREHCEVGRAVVAVGGVDPDVGLVLHQPRRDRRPPGGLVGGRDRVLQVDDDGVPAGGGGFAEPLGSVAGYEQQGRR